MLAPAMVSGLDTRESRTRLDGIFTTGRCLYVVAGDPAEESGSVEEVYSAFECCLFLKLVSMPR